MKKLVFSAFALLVALTVFEARAEDRALQIGSKRFTGLDAVRVGGFVSDDAPRGKRAARPATDRYQFPTRPVFTRLWAGAFTASPGYAPPDLCGTPPVTT